MSIPAWDPSRACTARCGEWRYDPRPSWVQLSEFYWQKTNGTQVLATNLSPGPGQQQRVAASLGNGTYTPLCLSWVVTSGTTHTLQYIKLSLTTHKWSKISAAELSTC